MSVDAVGPIPSNLPIQTSKLPHNEIATAEKWGHRFTKIAYVTGVVAVIAFAVAVVAAAVFFSGGTALPILIAFGSLFALTGAGTAIVKYFQHKMELQQHPLSQDQELASRLYEVMGNDLIIDDIKTIEQLPDKQSFLDYIQLINARNKGAGITDNEIQEARRAVRLPSNLLDKIELPRSPSIELPYANLIPKLESVLGDKFNSNQAQVLLNHFKSPIDQIRVMKTLEILEKIDGYQGELDLRDVGDVIINNLGSDPALNNILYNLAEAKLNINLKPIFEWIKANPIDLHQQDLLWHYIHRVITANSNQLVSLKNEVLRAVSSQNKDELFNIILGIKAEKEWKKYVIDLLDPNSNILVTNHQFLSSLALYPVQNPIDLIADRSTPPFLSYDMIVENLPELRGGPILLVTKDEMGNPVIKEYIVQMRSAGFSDYDPLNREYYSVKLENNFNRLVEAIPLSKEIDQLALGQAVRNIGAVYKSSTDIPSIEIEYQTRKNPLEDNKYQAILKKELDQSSLANEDSEYLLDNWKDSVSQAHLIRLLQYLKVIKDMPVSEEKAFHIRNAATPFFQYLLREKRMSERVKGFQIFDKLIANRDLVVPEKYNEAKVRISDIDLILTRIPKQEFKSFTEGLVQLEEYYLTNIITDSSNPKKLNNILQPLLKQLDESNMGDENKQNVLTAIHRLSSINPKTFPIFYDEAVRLNADPMTMYLIEVGGNRELQLKKGTATIITNPIDNPIVTEAEYQDAGNDFADYKNSKIRTVEVDPIGITNLLQSTDAHLTTDTFDFTRTRESKVTLKFEVKNKNGESVFLQLSKRFALDLNRSLYIINGKVLKGPDVVQSLFTLLEEDTEALRKLSVLLSQGILSLPLQFTTRKFVELVLNGTLDNPQRSGPIYKVDINKNNITLNAREEAIHKDRHNLPKKLEIISANLNLNKNTFGTLKDKESTYTISQQNAPLENFEFLGREHANDVLILQQHLLPIHIDLLKDFIAYRNSIGESPTDQQLALLLEKQTAILEIINLTDLDKDFISSLQRILLKDNYQFNGQSYPENLDRLQSILQHYTKNTLFLFENYNYETPNLSSFNVNKNDPANLLVPIRWYGEPFATNYGLENVSDLDSNLDGSFLNHTWKNPRYMGKSPITLSDGKQISFPTHQIKGLEKTRFIVQKLDQKNSNQAFNTIYELLGKDVRQTELIAQLANSENEKALEFQAQKWAHDNYPNSETSVIASWHQFEILEGKPIYTIEMMCEVKSEDKEAKISLRRTISFSEEDLKSGVGNSSVIQDKMIVTK